MKKKRILPFSGAGKAIIRCFNLPLGYTKIDRNVTFWLLVESISKNQDLSVQTRKTRFVGLKCSLQILAKMGQCPLI